MPPGSPTAPRPGATARPSSGVGGGHLAPDDVGRELLFVVPAGAGDGLDVAGVDGLAALVAHHVGLAALPAALVDQLHRDGLADACPLVAPLHQRDEDRMELEALVGQAVLEALGPLLVAPALEDAVAHQRLEPGGEHVAGDAEAALEVLETADAEEGIPQHEERPPLAHDLEGTGHGTVHPGEAR